MTALFCIGAKPPHVRTFDTCAEAVAYATAMAPEGPPSWFHVGYDPRQRDKGFYLIIAMNGPIRMRAEIERLEQLGCWIMREL